MPSNNKINARRNLNLNFYPISWSWQPCVLYTRVYVYAKWRWCRSCACFWNFKYFVRFLWLLLGAAAGNAGRWIIIFRFRFFFSFLFSASTYIKLLMVSVSFGQMRLTLFCWCCLSETYIWNCVWLLLNSTLHSTSQQALAGDVCVSDYTRIDAYIIIIIIARGKTVDPSQCRCCFLCLLHFTLCVQSKMCQSDSSCVANDV